MDQDQIEITINDRNSAEIEEPAEAAVGEAFNAHEGSKEADSGSQPQNLNHGSDAQEFQAGEIEMTYVETRIRTLTKVKGLDPTKENLWKVAFEHYSERLRTSENLRNTKKEEMRSIKNEIYQVVGFFSAFQGLLITAALQSNLLRCNNVGFILALSAFATALAVFGIWQKITAMEELRFAHSRIEHRMQVSPYNIFFLGCCSEYSTFRIYVFERLIAMCKEIESPVFQISLRDRCLYSNTRFNNEERRT